MCQGHCHACSITHDKFNTKMELKELDEAVNWIQLVHD